MESDGLDIFQDGPFIYRLNDNGCGPNLLQKVCQERGWRDYHQQIQNASQNQNDEWNLWWRSSGFPVSHHKNMQSWQFSNHIPNGSTICRKDNLARHLKCMRKIYGSIYDFSPKGFHLPLEYAKLVAECTRLRRESEGDGNSSPNKDHSVWICKPVSQSQGRGIFLFRRLSELTYDGNSVVQRYIERPFLIAGYKFDLRLYVCVPSYHPLTVYMYSEGLARFGTDKFSLSDIYNPYRHLTNSSLNKTGPRYAECKDRIGSGCKWTLKQLRRHLSAVGARDWALWQRIRQLVVLTLLAQAAGVPSTRNCFEFYGFDVLIDDDMRPWLLEVNLAPALAHDCLADVQVKRPMLHDLFDLLGLPMRHTGLALYVNFNNNNNYEEKSDYENEDEGGESNGRRRSIGLIRAAGKWRQHHKQARPGTATKPAAQNPTPVPPPPTPSSTASKANGDQQGTKAIPRGRSAKPQRRNTRGPRPPRQAKLATLNISFPDIHSPRDTSVSGCANGPSVEDTWGRYSTLTNIQPCNASDGRGTRKASISAPKPQLWGNGVDWSRAPAYVGGWVRLFPHEMIVDQLQPSVEKSPLDDAFTQSNGTSYTRRHRQVVSRETTTKSAVAAVARFGRAVRESARACPPDADDADLEVALVNRIGEVTMWIPPR